VPGPVWIGTSWKMNKTIAEARDYVDRLLATPLPSQVQAFLVPPLTALAAVRDRLPPGCPVLLGAQNAHWAAEGAGTGEVSMRMVHDAGASIVEIGHSERRQHFGETDRTVALKVRAAVDADLVPLVCVGEPAEVRDAAGADQFVQAQLRIALSRLTPPEVRQCLVAYEPVWAIGAGGRPATPAEVAPVLAVLAEELTRLSGGVGCRALLYGGGVDQDNAAELLRGTAVNGLFIGRAAWTPEGLRTLLTVGQTEAAARGTTTI
jgi:triosephosphate isomerase